MRPRAIVPGLAVIAIFLTAPFGCKKGQDILALKRGKDFNLLLITVDSLRPDRLGAYGFKDSTTPTLDRLAGQGWIFRNCYTSVPLSRPSHSTIFTGRGPLAHGVRTDRADVLPEGEQTWAEVMRNNGFETYAVVSSYLLHSKFGLKQGFDAYDDSLDDGSLIHHSQTAIGADRVYFRFQSWLSQRTAGKFFAWVHFSDPQSRHELPPEYAKAFASDPYSGEVAFVDHHIGEIVHALEGRNLFDRTVIVIAGSSGEALGEHREWGHGLFCYESTLKVPLIIRAPGSSVKSKTVSSRVRLLDLLPSVLQLFGLESPSGIQGQSFLEQPKDNTGDLLLDRPAYFESLTGAKEMGFAPLTGLIRENDKYIALPEPELYDLKNDPGETKNLAPTKPDLVREMDAALRQAVESQGGKSLAGLTKTDQNVSATPAIDPKKGIDAVERTLEVGRLIEAKNWTDAERALDGIRSDRPGWTSPQMFDAQLRIDGNKNDRAAIEKTFRQASEKYPEIDRFMLSLVQFLTSAGRLGEAEKLCLDALARNPRLSQAHILLAAVYQKEGQAARGLVSLEKALTLEPENARLQLEVAARSAELGKKESSLDLLKNLMKKRALSADPSAADLQAEIGSLLMKIGEFEMANTLLLDVVAQGKATSMVWTQIGLGYFNKGNPEKARESLEKAISLDPKNGTALSGLGTFHLSLFRQRRQKDDLNKAIAYYTQAKEADPKLAAAVNGLGVAYRYAGDAGRAIDCWKEALALDPGFTDTYFNLGITLMDTGRKQEALQVLTLCKEKYSDRLSAEERRQLDKLIAEIR
jgi:arylsulfatase A-like enzyme/tetratricopeptide (TPR) repeat protein